MSLLNNSWKIVLDVETTGLPDKVKIFYKNCKNEDKYKLKYVHPTFYEKYENCRIIEIAYVILNENDEIVKKSSFLIKGRNIQNSQIHGITNEMCEEQGLNIQDFFSSFENDLKNVSIFVAHNAEFDFTILLSECYRYGKTDLIYKLKKIKIYCTMNNGSRILQSNKFLKLIELYQHFYKDSVIQNHRALDDVMLCYKSYLKIIPNFPVFTIMDYHESI